MKAPKCYHLVLVPDSASGNVENVWEQQLDGMMSSSVQDVLIRSGVSKTQINVTTIARHRRMQIRCHSGTVTFSLTTLFQSVSETISSQFTKVFQETLHTIDDLCNKQYNHQYG